MWCSTISTVRPSSRCTARISSTRPSTSSARDPGHRLVEQHHRGSARQQHRELQLAFVAVREHRRRPPARRASPTSLERPIHRRRVTGPAARRAGPERAARGRLGREPDVLDARRAREHAEIWNVRPIPAGPVGRRPAGDVAPAQLDRPGRRAQRPREQVEQRRLPCPVRADDADELARADLEGRRRRRCCAPPMRQPSPAWRREGGVAHDPRDRRDGATSSPAGRRLAMLRDDSRMHFARPASFTWNIGWIIAWSAARIGLRALRAVEAPALERGDHLVDVVALPSRSARTIICAATKPSG